MRLRLTNDVIERFAAAIRAGETFTAAAQTVGVDPRTAHRWRSAGEREDGTLRAQFAAAVSAALDQAAAQGMTEDDLIAALEQQARRGSVKAATWLLERRWPERWAARTAARPSEQQAGPDPWAELDAFSPAMQQPPEWQDAADELGDRRRSRARRDQDAPSPPPPTG